MQFIKNGSLYVKIILFFFIFETMTILILTEYQKKIIQVLVFFLGQIYSLFTLYSAEGDEQLSVSVGRDVSIYYEDTDEMPLENNLIPFDVSLDDGG